MFSWLAQRSGENPLSEEERLIFFTQFGGYDEFVRNSSLSIKASRELVRKVRTVVRSKTTAVLSQSGYVFVGTLDQTGGGKALLYHIIHSETGVVKCGKVYKIDVENEEIVTTESSASSKIHHDGVISCVVRYETCLRFAHETAPQQQMVALVMPLYQMSLATIIDAYVDNPLPMNMYRKLVRCLLTAATRLHQIELVHCDIKPENIMICNGEFTVIDLGAVTAFGQAAREHTMGYAMEASRNAVSGQFDMFCIASTLARCCCYEVKANNTTARLSHWLASPPPDSIQDQQLWSLYMTPIQVCLNEAQGETALIFLREWSGMQG